MFFTVDALRLTPRSLAKTVIAFAEAKAKLTDEALLVDEELGGALKASLRGTRFTGAMGEIHRLTVGEGRINQVVLVGVGKFASLERRDFWKVGMILGKTLDVLAVKDATLALGATDAKCTPVEQALALVEGMHMAMYRFENFKSELKPHTVRKFESLSLLTSTPIAREIMANMLSVAAILDAQDLTRDVANLPPNIANPEYMANEARKLEKLGVKVTVIDEVQMKKLGMNLFLAVGGSAAKEDQPRLVLMEYNGIGKASKEPIALVGKGVMFDTGGYNLKPSAAMGNMKFDMCGSAAVLGTMKALAARKAPVHVVGVLACAMNMVGETPFLPDSVYKSYKGLFVEIGNTDAEGRLVLADAVAYTVEKYKPSQLVDLATLTGACVVALGGAYAGLFSTSSALAGALRKAGDDVGERLWPMPIDDCYAAKTQIADVNNDGNPYGGASTGAVFVKRFADKTPWAHLDIAGVAYKDKGPGIPEQLSGSTGFGVRLLNAWLDDVAADMATKAVPSTAKGKRRGRPRKVA